MAKVIGQKATIKSIKYLAGAIKVKANKELLAIGLDIETDAKEKITEDHHVDTGRLRASLHTENPKTSTNQYSDGTGRSFKGKLSETPKDNQVFIGTNVKYAQFIERRDSYMRYAYDKNIPKLKVMAKKLGKLIWEDKYKWQYMTH